MERNIKTFLFTFLFVSLGILTILSCEDDQKFSSFEITNDFRILKTNYSGKSYSELIPNFDPLGSIELIFSHGVEKSVFEKSISIVPNAQYSFTYDDSNSFVSLKFIEPLEYGTDYSLTIPQGIYGQSGESSIEDFKLIVSSKPFVKPTISFSTEGNEVYEGKELALKVSLSESILKNVSFDLLFSGTAQKGLDYSVSSETITLEAGTKEAIVTISNLVDSEPESPENLIIGIDNLINATADSSIPIEINFIDESPQIEFKGVMELQGYDQNEQIRAVHLSVLSDIEDLNIYGVEIASNGAVPNPSDIEFTFPSGTSAKKGDQLFIVRDIDLVNAQTYFESCLDSFIIFESSKITANGDDVFVLYKDQKPIEYFGEPGVDGTGLFWEYTNSWAYKLDGEWIFAGVDAVVGAGVTNSGSNSPYPFCNPLQLQGVTALLWDGSGSNGGKSIHVRANRDILNLSLYGLGVANNGGGTDGVEYTFPNISVKEGDHILIAREPETISNYYGSCNNGYDFILQGDFVSQNGDDAIELFFKETVVETFGDANIDGTEQPWEYTGSWAYKSTSGSWSNGSLECAVAATENSSSSCPYPFCN